MSGATRIFRFLREQQERLLVITGLVGLIASAARGLVDDSAPPVLWLGIFSLLLLAAGLWMVWEARKARRTPAPASVGYSTRQVVIAWSAGAVVLALAWGVVFRGRILYSSAVAWALGQPRALISRSLAWQVLPDEGPGTAKRFRTIASEAASLLEGTPYRVVVLDTRGHEPEERDAFVLDGAREGASLVLRAGMVINGPRARRLIQQVSAPWRPPETEDAVSTLTPLKRFLRNPFLFSKFSIQVAVPAGTRTGDKTLFARLVLWDAVATTLFFDGDSGADRAFDAILSRADLLPGAGSSLADIYRHAAYYFATEGGQLDKAVSALDVVQRLSPDDERVPLAKAFLLLASGARDAAGAILGSAESDPGDPAALPTLKGEYFLASERFDSAIASFQKALSHERDETYRVRLLTNLALTYGRNPRISDAVMSRQMIASLEDAITLEPTDLVSHILQGYAWAVGDNAAMSRLAFARAYRLIAEGDTARRKLYAYWLGRSLVHLKSAPAAVDTLTRLVGEPETQQDDNLLFIFAAALIEMPGREAEAERYLDRALELNPAFGKAHRYKARVLLARLLADSSGADPAAVRGQATEHLLRALRFGDDGPQVRLMLAELYREAGDTINADKHEARACELDPDTEACRFREARRLVSIGAFAEAQQLFQEIQSRDSTSADLALQEALIWYQAGRLAEAERANRRGIGLDAESAPGHNNLAFVLFDLDRAREALGHWEQSLRLLPGNADALAGKAIALQTLHQGDALSIYSQAAELDDTYRDCRVMQQKYSWSMKACAAAAPLITRLGSTSQAGRAPR